MDTKLNPNKEKKAKIVAEIADKVTKAKALVFTNYQGLTHHQIEEFKKRLRKLEAEYTITKNTLLKRALDEKSHSLGEQHLDQPTATLFLYGDPVTPLKILAKMIKDMQKPSIKFAIMEGNLINEQQVLQLATLPSRDVLLAQLVGAMQFPIFGLHRSLNWNLQKLVMTLKTIEQTKAQIQT